MDSAKEQFTYSFIRKSVPDDISSSFKVRDDDLSSKQGSLCTFKLIFLSSHTFTYIIIFVI